MKLYKVEIEEKPADTREILMSEYELATELQKRRGYSHDEALTELYLLGNTSNLPTEDDDEWSVSWIEQ